MFRFAEPIYLYALLALPLIAALHYWTSYIRRRRLQRFGDKELVMALMPMHSSLRLEVKFWLRMAALALLCFTLARPQYGTRVETDRRQGIEAIICLDVSRSMLARDVTPSRLDKAKMLISSMVDNMNDDKLGLIIFAGDAFTQLPITSDYVSAKMFLDHISPDLIEVQGTDLSNALDLAMHSFTPTEGVAKAIFVITDGEDHEGGAEEKAKEAAEQGYNIFILGVGLPDGAPVPLTDGGNDYISDETGRPVVSKLNVDMCQRLAAAGNGAYIYVDNSSSAQTALGKHLDHLQKSEVESTVYNEHDEQFIAVAALAFLLLLAELCLTDARNPWFDRFKLFQK